MIITIDGPVATGKSTIAKRLATSIGYIYFDTGAVYRAFTYGVIKNHVQIDQGRALEQYIEKFDFDIRVRHGDKRYFLENEDITDQIRQDQVTLLVSKVSAHPRVREHLLKYQRDLAKGVNAVFEGRDMGTVVFPDAYIKVFLSGSPDVRARRRYDELTTKYPEQSKGLTVEKVLEDLNARDAFDSNREISPLKKAADAFEIDTSNLSIDEIVYKILEYKDTRKTYCKSNSEKPS
ncbi:Cytidylate kinase [Chlamydiales bacterium STE3]|nr:Cytidylate kinase [Chlamydiales bacterium STE3]